MTKTFSKEILKAGLLLFAVLLVAFAIPSPVCAADTASGVQASIPVQEKVTGDTPGSSLDFAFKLTPVSDNAPLPTNGTTLNITGSGNGQFNFDMSNVVPGDIFEYKLTQETVTADNYTSDTASYTVKIYVFRHEDDSLFTTVQILSGDTKCDSACFTNKYTAPAVPEKTTPESPYTGILKNTDFQILLAVIAAAAVILVVTHKKKSAA
ncbi:MAG: Spy0128 family protein [Eubacteriaceae bacterium]|jgi:hypothetical protein